MQKSIIFINHLQFGYHIDYAQYCKYLKSDFKVTYLCWDYDNKKIKEPDVTVIYISRNGNIVLRNIRFIRYVINNLRKQKYSFVFINYFQGVSIISLFCKSYQSLHLDIRTGSISRIRFFRNIYNFLLKIESFFFESKSIISEGLQAKLGISNNVYILPLGANRICINRQFSHKLHLLYIGTLTNRRIEDTIEGIKIFLDMHPNVDIHYTIIGDGWKNEKRSLQNRVNQYGLQKYIDLIGYVQHNELLRYFEISNIGVSYIPITPYYEFQPATKTFEYLMVGMPVIATQTYENKKIITKLNGVLIKDTPLSFAIGIVEILKSLNSFNHSAIIKSVDKYEWSQIINAMKINIFQ